MTTPKKIRVADLFCGAGGATEAALRAMRDLGLTVDHFLAVNHWETAIETQSKNHPQIRHLCESIDVVNPRDQVPGGRLHLLIAAPECTYFSTARGGRPVTDQQRTQPWVILKWLQELYVENVLIENVPEFRNWGPIGANGKPLKRHKGETYRAFIETIRSLGYTVEDRILNAADYGDPTTRRRLFIIAKRGKKSIQWPSPTHSATGGRTLFGPTKKWRAAREVIDWSIPGRSIFGRKKALSPKTLARIVAGLERFGGDELKPFLIVLRNHADARSLDRPLPTLSAQGQHVGLVEPAVFVMPVTHGSDGSKRERSIDEPLPTITCANRGELAVCEPFILSTGSNGAPRSVDNPTPTAVGAASMTLIEPFVLQQQSGGVPRSTDEPLPTIATDGAQMLVEPFVVTMEHRGSTRSIDQPLPTITTAKGGAFAVVEPFLVPHYGERAGQAPRTHSVDAPVPTIPATGDGKFELVQPFLVSAGGPKVGPRSTEEPMNTVLTRGNMALIEPEIREDASIIASYYGTQNVSPVTAPLPTVTTRDRFALVMPVVNGRALDIRLRMLKPHELARAMSFGDEYTFAGNQGEQVKQIGNAWPVRLGQALITSILEEYAAAKPTRRRLEVVA